MDEFCAITVFFNPAGFSSLLSNYFIFSERLKRQGVRLITVECSFDGKYYIPENPGVYRLSSSSVMWQKERLINYGVSKLPPECKYYGWVDCDVLFHQDDWAVQAAKKLETADVIQLFKKVYYMPKGMSSYDGSKIPMFQGVVWQWKTHHSWLARRRCKTLDFSVPGFAWACRRELFADLGGLYERNIVGSGDTFMVDCYLDSWDIHGFAGKFNDHMKIDLMAYCARLREKKPVLDFIPTEISHLWHGSLKNRRYMDRHDIIRAYDYDPQNDVELCGDVLEWNSDKPEMHAEIREYFHKRKEDEELV